MKSIIPKNYTVIKDVSASKIEDLEMVKFLKKDEKYISGEELRKRAVKLNANSGIKDCEYLLNNQNKIPQEFRSNYLIFTGTLLRDSDGRLRIASLYWHGVRWYLLFDWIGYDFHGDVRLVRCKSKNDTQISNSIKCPHCNKEIVFNKI